MRTFDTKYIKFENGNRQAWLGEGVDESGFPDVVDVTIRKMLAADEGYVLAKDGEQIGECVWLKDGDSADNYTEEEPIVEEPVEEEPSPEIV